MHIVSISVGRPRALASGHRTVLTSIRKTPVPGRVAVRTFNVDGDEQSDLTVHGGVDKAVYAYPSEHYGYWRAELPGIALPWGAFGENFTTEGLLEGTVRIGDRLQIGSAAFTVTQPRMPCFKLGMHFGKPDVVKRFLASGRTGYYLKVIQEGDVAAGDTVTVASRDDQAITVADIVRLHRSRGARNDEDEDLLRRAIGLVALPATWRDEFREDLKESAVSHRSASATRTGHAHGDAT